MILIIYKFSEFNFFYLFIPVVFAQVPIEYRRSSVLGRNKFSLLYFTIIYVNIHKYFLIYTNVK